MIQTIAIKRNLNLWYEYNIFCFSIYWLDEEKAENLLQPPEQSYVNRRQQFQRILTNRRRGNVIFDPYTSTERSFDSFDTSTTDGAHSSESSRVEVTTTSIDSTTTNDSSADSYTKRQIMRENKDDSGYKSLEQRIPASPTPCIVISSTMETPAALNDRLASPSALVPSHYTRPIASRRQTFQAWSIKDRPSLNIRTSFSSFELETTDSNMASCESTEDRLESGKPGAFLSVYPSGSSRRQMMQRDYSVDEKTDAIFKEFARYDPKYDVTSTIRSRSTPSMRMEALSNSKALESSYEDLHCSNTDKTKLKSQGSVC